MPGLLLFVGLPAILGYNKQSADPRGSRYVNTASPHSHGKRGTIMQNAVTQLLKDQIWYLATYDDEPNAVPVAFKDVTDDGKLVVGDVFLDTTLRNIKKNGKIAVSACNAATLEGYQIKGTAQYVTDGPIVETFKAQVETMFHGAATAKGALIITPERVIITTPGADNKKEL